MQTPKLARICFYIIKSNLAEILVFRKMQSRVSTTAVESPLNRYSLLSVEEVPKDNEEVDDVAEEIHVIKPTTRSEGT